jgi:microcystin degradation protein MlrC
MRRVGIVQLWQEVNTYSPRRTGLAEIREFELARGEDILARHAGTGSVIGGFLAKGDFEAVPLFAAGAWPAGPPDEATASALLEELRDVLDAAPRLDGVLMNLHGAMVGDGHPDMELDAARAVREATEAPIACVLDLHGIPSSDFVAACDAVIGYDTYPHVDMFDRGREAAALLMRCVEGEPWTSAIAKLPFLTTPLAQATGKEPMRSLLAEAKNLGLNAGLERVSLLPGFPYSDVDRAGFSVIGVAPTDRRETLVAAVDAIAARVEERIGEFAVDRPDPADAVGQALRARRGPVVIADIADNVGGGGAGDGTALLHELIEQGGDGAIVTLSDAAVARQAAGQGPGSRMTGKLGAKLDSRHGVPVTIDAEVVRTSDGHYRSLGTYMSGQTFSLGATVHLRHAGIDLVVTERAVPPFHGEQITHLGLDPAAARVITAKGAVAWRSAFGDLPTEVVEADTPGVTPLHPEVLARTSQPVRVEAAAAATPAPPQGTRG